MDSPRGSGVPTKGRPAGGAALANGNGYVQAPGEEEDDGRGLLGDEPSRAGSIEVRVVCPES